MREAYNQRRRYLMSAFKEMGLECFEPFGAFYVFPCIKEFGLTSDEFATRFLKEEKVAIVPGTAFGDCGEGFLRISYASSLENLKIAMGRLAPSRHSICFGKTVNENGPLLHSRYFRNRYMFVFVSQFCVNFIGHHEYIMFDNDLRDFLPDGGRFRRN